MFDYSDHGPGQVTRFKARSLFLWVLAIALVMAVGIAFVIEYASSAFVDANRALDTVQQLRDAGTALAERMSPVRL